MAFPPINLWTLCAGLGIAQWGVTYRFYRLFRKSFSAPPSEYFPSVSILCACKGDVEGLEQNILSLLRQDYPGRLEFLFVTPSKTDSAHARLENILSGARASAKLLASEKKPACCSGKLADLLYALDWVSIGSEILLFADADILVTPAWLRDMVAPLKDPRIGASAAFMLYVPTRSRGLWTFLRFVYMGAGIPYVELLDCVTGQSCAIRKKDFFDLGLPEIWAHSLMDDLTLTGRLKSAGRKVQFVARAMPISLQKHCTAGLFFAQFNRWICMFRVYAKTVWAFGLLVTATKIYAIGWSLRPPIRWSLLALVLGMDMINLFWVFSVYRRFLGDRLRDMPPAYRNFSFLAGLSAPLLQVVYPVNFFSSLWVRTIRWGAVTYRVRGPQDISVVSDSNP